MTDIPKLKYPEFDDPKTFGSEMDGATAAGRRVALTPETPMTEGQQVQLRFKGKEVLVRVTKVETPQKTYEGHIVGFPSADTPLELDGLKPGDIVGFSHDRIARLVT